MADGAIIDVGDLQYKVVRSETVSKEDLWKEQALWNSTPGMLVFVTCMQFTTPSGYQSNGHSTTNAVIVGQLVT